MKYYIVVDGGTTNTRASLVKGTKILDTIRIPFGARSRIDNQNALPRALSDAIGTLLSSASVSEDDIECVLASGMISSEFGLCNLPHLHVPAGISELHKTMHRKILKDITSIPFVFVRGVKQIGKSPLETDMMRGEETELMGLIEQDAPQSLYILPGSHSKLIETDDQGRIVRFSSMLTGEMIASLSQNTILKDAIDLSIKTCDRAYLLDGCRYATQKGINEALFKVRILKNLFSCTSEQVYSFFLGVVLSGEISAILQSPVPRVVVGGKAQIKHATCTLLQALGNKTVIEISDEDVDASQVRGILRIYEYQA